MRLKSSIIPERIRLARKMRGLSQMKLAEILSDADGKDIEGKRNMLSKWERGESLPDTSSLIALCNALDVDIDYLLGGLDADCPRRVVHDVKQSTGLSAVAAQRLIAMNEKASREIAAGWVGTFDQRVLDAISLLLERDVDVFYNVSQYVQEDYDGFMFLTENQDGTEREVITRDVTLCQGGNTDGGTVVSAGDLKTLYLTKVTESLARLKQSVRD